MSRHSARGRVWDAFREAVLMHFKRRCQLCGCAGRLEVHHVKPLGQGGRKYDMDNVTVLCRACHFDAHPPREKVPGRREWKEFVA